MNSQILVVEDEDAILSLVSMTLEMIGLEVMKARSGKEALRIINNEPLNLAILDVMLPDGDGFALLPQALKRGIPVIFLTARTSMTDKVKGLNLGADDYITKPFEGVELVARVRAVLRRKGQEVVDGFDDINVNIAERKVYKSGQQVDLTPKEYDLLVLLLENRNIALTREKILDLVWGYEFEGATRTVDVHIQRLRSKLQTDRIKTIVKIGYRLEC
ncbi:MAG: response regulator transcription factor [Methylocystaceae bacterium]